MIDGLIQEVEKRARLMGAMLERFGIDIETASQRSNGCALTAAVRRCRGCSETGACQDYLAKAPDSRTPPAFCPNADFLADLTS